jgi:hypothetical protein
MNVLQKEGFLMPPERNEGFGYDLHGTFVKTHQTELMAEASANRAAHASRPEREPRDGLRRSLGHLLVRVGRALADETPGAPIQSA